MDVSMDYHVPEALTIIAGTFLALGAVCMALVAGDIVVRRGWKTMMLIMIPVYPINAAYMPLSIYVYWKYGRPPKPDGSAHGMEKMASSGKQEALGETADAETDAEMGLGHHDGMDMDPSHDGPHDPQHGMTDGEDRSTGHSAKRTTGHGDSHAGMHGDMHASAADGGHGGMHGGMGGMHGMHDMHGPSPDRPMWATVAMGVMHCGAGCVLGDIVGEWLVYGTDATINGKDIWPCLLIDYGFALLFGIAFQYLSIAPMTGEWGLKTVWRAAKADFLSLTFFEIGLFGWMVIYQVAIWDYRLMMNTWTYWWMMQVGMFLGFFTAFPINWWLIKQNIKV